jgi:hypothetical protein
MLRTVQQLQWLSSVAVHQARVLWKQSDNFTFSPLHGSLPTKHGRNDSMCKQGSGTNTKTKTPNLPRKVSANDPEACQDPKQPSNAWQCCALCSRSHGMVLL